MILKIQIRFLYLFSLINAMRDKYLPQITQITQICIKALGLFLVIQTAPVGAHLIL